MVFDQIFGTSKKKSSPANHIPPSILEILQKDYPGEKINSAVHSDITAEGRFGVEWLVVTDRTILSIALNGSSPAVLSRLEIASVRSIDFVSYIGKGALVARTDCSVHRIISFSDARHAAFAKAAEVIKRSIEGRVDDIDVSDTCAFPPEAHCERCNNRIPQGKVRCPRCSHKGRIFLRILDFSMPYSKLLFLILLFMLLSTGFGLITPYISKLFVDYIFKANPATGNFDYAGWLPLAVSALLFAYTAQIFLGGVRERLSGSLGYKTVYDVRAAIYAKLQELSLSYFDKHQTGSLLAKVNQDTSELQLFIVDFLPITLESVILLIGVGAFLFVLSWKLTLFILLPVAASAVFLKEIFPRIGIYFHRYFHRRSRLSALVNDSLSGIRVIKTFGRESEEVDKFDRRSAGYRDAGVELTKQWSIYHPILQFFIMTGGVMVWWIGGGLVLAKQMSVGSVIAYAGYLAMFYEPVLTLARLAEVLTNSLSAAERVFDVIDTQPDIKDDPDAVAMPHIRGKIEFRNVTFGYSPFKPTVKDLSIAIDTCETVGLVGRSGAGKSTIINLICRLYDPGAGQILIDGVDIRKIRHADLRRQVGVVLQETFLFNGTIYDNIAYARPEATREEVIEAAMMANAHEFILAKPDAYDTEVGERGGRLSGGERQRIAIARAILRNPAILILDEATASVDTQTEKKIQEALDNLKRNRTTIAIAHRLSTLRNFHRLFVIKNGTLVEDGTHEELMEKKGAFYDLVMLQQQDSVAAAEGRYDEAA